MIAARLDLWARFIDEHGRMGTPVQPYMPDGFGWWNEWLDATAQMLRARNVDHITITYRDGTGHEYRLAESSPLA